MRGSIAQHPAFDYRAREELGGPTPAQRFVTRARSLLALPQHALTRARGHVHTWALEPALETGEAASGDIDGELYVSPGRRGDVRGVCECGASRTFHPFINTRSRVDAWEGAAS